MSLHIKQPGNNENPDTSGGGNSAVTGATNTGHAGTVASASNGSGQQKGCRWRTFPAGAGQVQTLTLKFDHTSSGGLTGAGASNAFSVEYSLNNGSSWTTAVSRSNFTSTVGPTTFSVALPLAQDITQVQVRDLLLAQTLDIGESANVLATIANVQVEIVLYDVGCVAMM